MCGFLEKNVCLHLGTPAIVTLFLLQTDTLAPIREGKSYVALAGKSLGTPVHVHAQYLSEFSWFLSNVVLKTDKVVRLRGFSGFLPQSKDVQVNWRL